MLSWLKGEIVALFAPHVLLITFWQPNEISSVICSSWAQKNCCLLPYCQPYTETLCLGKQPSDRCGKPIRFSTLCKTFCKWEEKNTAAILETNLLPLHPKKRKEKKILTTGSMCFALTWKYNRLALSMCVHFLEQCREEDGLFFLK